MGRKEVRAVRVELVATKAIDLPVHRMNPAPSQEWGQVPPCLLHVFWLKNQMNEAGKQEAEGMTGTKCRIHRMWWHTLVNSALRRLSRRSENLGLGQRETLSQKAANQWVRGRVGGGGGARQGAQLEQRLHGRGSLQTKIPHTSVSPAAALSLPALTGFCNC